MKNIPQKIYLQVDPNNEGPEDFNNLHGITWAKERMNDNDFEYSLSVGWQGCPTCSGRGWIFPSTGSSDTTACPTCNGKRIISTVTGLPPE